MHDFFTPTSVSALFPLSPHSYLRIRKLVDKCMFPNENVFCRIVIEYDIRKYILRSSRMTRMIRSFTEVLLVDKTCDVM